MFLENIIYGNTLTLHDASDFLTLISRRIHISVRGVLFDSMGEAGKDPECEAPLPEGHNGPDGNSHHHGALPQWKKLNHVLKT